GQEQVLDLNLTAHAVRQEDILKAVDGDRLNRACDLGPALPEPAKVDGDGNEGDECPGCRRNRYLSCHLNKPLYIFVFTGLAWLSSAPAVERVAQRLEARLERLASRGLLEQSCERRRHLELAADQRLDDRLELRGMRRRAD